MKYLEFEHLLPMTLDEAWSFFSSPGNLNLITPDDLDFKILDTLPDVPGPDDPLQDQTHAQHPFGLGH